MIVDRGPNTHLIRVYIGRDSNGKRKFVNETFHGTISQAKARERKLMGEKDTGTIIVPTKTTLEEYIRGWLDQKANVSKGTLADYKQRAEADIYPFLGTIALVKLTPAHVA